MAEPKAAWDAEIIRLRKSYADAYALLDNPWRATILADDMEVRELRPAPMKAQSEPEPIPVGMHADGTPVTLSWPGLALERPADDDMARRRYVASVMFIATGLYLSWVLGVGAFALRYGLDDLATFVILGTGSAAYVGKIIQKCRFSTVSNIADH